MEELKHFRIWLFGPLHVEQKQADATWKEVPVKWERQADHLLCYLLCTPKRRARRGTLIEALFPESDDVQAEGYLRRTVQHLKPLFGDQAERFLFTYGGDARHCIGYALADSSVLWTDLDEVKACIQKATYCGSTNDEALCWLEQVDLLLDRGELLEQESGEWSFALVMNIQDSVNQCRQWLIEIYERQGKFQQAREQLHKLLAANPDDEEIERYGKTMRQHISRRSLFASSLLSAPTTSLVSQENYEALSLQGLDMDQQRRQLLQAGALSMEELLIPRSGTFGVPLIAAPRLLTPIHASLAAFQQDIHLIWHLHFTSSAHDRLNDIWTATRELDVFEKQVRGDLHKQVLDLLYGYYMLAVPILRTLREHQIAYSCANRAVQIAKNTNKLSMHASALYERGYTISSYGRYGSTNTMGRFEQNPIKIRDGIADMQEALKIASSPLKGIIMLELGRALASLQQDKKDITAAIDVGEQARQWIDQQEYADDLYSQMLTERSAFNLGRFYLGQAIIYNITGYHTKSLEMQKKLNMLQEGRGIAKSEIRSNAWASIAQAEAYMGLKEFDQAAILATDALQECKSIQSVNNIIVITDMYSRLLQESASKHTTVQRLGNALKGKTIS